MSDNDDDLCIPRSAMYKLVKELVPQVRLSGEAKDLIVTACNEFIHLLASEANTVCEKQSKKLILPDHVLLALDNLGFGEYKQDCIEVMKQMQEEVDKRKKLRNKLEKPGIPEEELLRQQNQLFAEARKQQQLIENAEEWSKVQQEAQIALQRQASCSNNSNNLNNSNNHSNNNHSSNGHININETNTNNNNSSFNNNNQNNISNMNNNTNQIYNKTKLDDDDDNYD
jgi:down-regulator of transcription 1